MKLVLRMRAHHHRLLAMHLQAALPSESIAFLLCQRISTEFQITYLVQQVVEVQNTEYLAREPDIASISPLAMATIAKNARDTGQVIVMAHIHPGASHQVEFSQADHIGNRRSFRFFHNRSPQNEHLALVWNSMMSSCKGIAYSASGIESQVSSVTVIDDKNWRDYVEKPNVILEQYSRQALLLGQAGQRKLNHVTVGIIGLGGLGSLISMAAVHHGFRHLILIDDDVVSESNLPRIVGSSPASAGMHSKVLLAEAYAKHHAPDTLIQALNSNVEAPDILEKLSACDVVISCTDNTTSRAFLTQFSNQYLVPLLDLGVQFSVNNQGTVVNEIGRINLSLPGTACLICTGHISPTRLAAESVPHEEREKEGSYLRGIDEPQPSMMSFNMEVAGRGMQVLVGFLSGFLPNSDTYEIRSFIRPKGSAYSRQISKRQQLSCPVCSEIGIIGCGSAKKFSISKRAF